MEEEVLGGVEQKIIVVPETGNGIWIAVIGLVAACVPLFIWWLKRRKK